MIVLMVEDDKVLSSAISDYLALDNIEIDYAYNGESGLNLATLNQYDVILLDIMLPKLNGFFCLSNAKKTWNFDANFDDDST